MGFWMASYEGLVFPGKRWVFYPVEQSVLEVLNRGRSHLPISFHAKTGSNLFSWDRVLAFDTYSGCVDPL